MCRAVAQAPGQLVAQALEGAGHRGMIAAARLRPALARDAHIEIPTTNGADAA
jgi:hypothetical protein